MMNSADNESAFSYAAARFDALGDYQDAAQKAAVCREKAVECRMESIYSSAVRMMQKGSESELESAAKRFSDIPDYKDAAELRRQCKDKIEALQAAGKAEQERIAEEQKQKKKKMLIALISGIPAILVIAAIITVPMIVKASRYNKAVEMLENGQYDDAKAAFSELSGYKDSNSRITEIDSVLEHQQKEQQKKEMLDQLKDVSVGDAVDFGNYEWYVVSTADNQVTLLCKDLVATKQFSSKAYSTWETCELREWLNHEFYNKFSSVEKTVIIKTLHNTSNTNETEIINEYEDYVYLMDFSSAKRLKNNLRECGSDWWVVEYDRIHYEKGAGGYTGRSAARLVRATGWVENALSVTLEKGVRPVITIQID